MQPNDLLTVAEHLYQQDSEAFWRSAANRYYYYAFHRCQQLAEEAQLPPAKNQNTGSHERLISRLINSSDNRLKKLGNTLRTFKKIRVKADYQLKASFNKQPDAYTALLLAKEFQKPINFS